MNPDLFLLSRVRVICSLLLIFTAFVIYSCKKDATTAKKEVVSNNDSDLIADAKAFFDKEVNANTDNALSNSFYGSQVRRQNLHKNGLTAKAYVQEFSFGKGVVIPVDYSDNERYLQWNGKYVPLSNMVNLLIYTDKEKKKHAELVTRIPNQDYLADTSKNKQFSGTVLVEDWKGNYLKGFLLKNGVVTAILGTPEEQNRNAVNRTRVNSYEQCTITDWYRWVSLKTTALKNNVKLADDGYWEYYDTTTSCITVAGGPDLGGASSGGPTGGDYGGVGGGGTGTGGGSSPCIPTPEPSQQSIKHVINAFGGNPTNPCTDAGGSGNNSGDSNPSYNVEIIYTVKDYPCLKALLLDKLLQQQNYAEFTIQFQTDQKPSLTWTDGSLAWNQYDSKTNSYTYKLGEEGADPNSSTGMSRNITLNTTFLQNGSQLLIAATMIHETLHAFIGYNISLAEDNVKNGYKDYGSWFAALDAFYTVKDLPANYSGHYQMLTDYFNQAVGILAQWDGNQHSQKDYVMSMLYGLNTVDPNCPDDMKARLNQVYNDMMSQYQITQDDLTDFNKNNLNASKFQKLPKSGC